MIQPGIEKIINVMTSKGYRIYDTDTIDWNLNIVGIRNKNLRPEQFDDTLAVFHKFKGTWYIYYYPITTDPSLHYLKNPIHRRGTAILMEGQYNGAYCIDKHRGLYDALCQRLGDVKYLEIIIVMLPQLNPATIEVPVRSINIHKRFNNDTDNFNHRAYSAGCQVFMEKGIFNEFMQKKAGMRSMAIDSPIRF
ncbi:MAG: hypothetical protein IPH28_24565 [Cytophagaceae bacterium]|nr:hypothetical protein [Cytophagaceae bacterium]